MPSCQRCIEVPTKPGQQWMLLIFHICQTCGRGMFNLYSFNYYGENILIYLLEIFISLFYCLFFFFHFVHLFLRNLQGYIMCEGNLTIVLHVINYFSVHCLQYDFIKYIFLHKIFHFYVVNNFAFMTSKLFPFSSPTL